nr:hypothetical protein Q903MT_gene2305 [Picea sitchensis]
MTAGKLLLTRFSKSICRLFVPVHLVIQADLSHFPVPPSSGPTFSLANLPSSLGRYLSFSDTPLFGCT